MNAIFTIVAKNYLPLAYTLQKSIARFHPDIPFYIFISDTDTKELPGNNIKHIYVDELDIEENLLNELAFKYNVTEFCTSIKPYCFQHLKSLGADKIIYFDPDIYIHDSLDFIFDYLENHILVITPHYCQLEKKYSGIRSEGLVLFSGVYNLGFCAVNMKQEGALFIEWWAERLINNSYADKWDGLHTDQKWIDIVHCIFEGPIKVLKHPGTNAAIWNMHERSLIKKNEKWYVRYKNKDEELPLIFYHFSSFGYYSEGMPNKLFPAYAQKFPYLFELCQEYQNELLKNKLTEYKNYKYSYDTFSNGDIISSMHRRFYRRVKDLDLITDANPFEVEASFYQMLKSSELLFDKVGKALDSQNELNMSGFQNKVQKINWIMRLVKKMAGIEKYFLLIKFFQRYFRFENQYFLINDLKNKYIFLNEGRVKEK